MTSDGVDGTAAGGRCEASPCDREPGAASIKCDDERPASRYIGGAYPNTPAAPPPKGARRERQVAFALRNHFDLLTVISICDAAGAGAPVRTLPAAIAAQCQHQPGDWALRRLAKRSR
jgi:hypothetical protein